MSENTTVDLDPTKEMQELLERFKPDYEKARKGNVAAGKRARKLMQELRKMCVDIRVRIMDFRNGSIEIKN